MVDGQKKLIRDLLFLSSEMAAMRARENLLLGQSSGAFANKSAISSLWLDTITLVYTYDASISTSNIRRRSSVLITDVFS